MAFSVRKIIQVSAYSDGTSTSFTIDISPQIKSDPALALATVDSIEGAKVIYGVWVPSTDTDGNQITTETNYTIIPSDIKIRGTKLVVTLPNATPASTLNVPLGTLGVTTISPSTLQATAIFLLT